MCKMMDGNPAALLTAETAVAMRGMMETPGSGQMDIDWTEEDKTFVAQCENEEVTFDQQGCPNN